MTEDVDPKFNSSIENNRIIYNKSFLQVILDMITVIKQLITCLFKALACEALRFLDPN